MLGAILGDTIGSVYEFFNHKSKDFKLFSGESHLTDDSYMTLAVMEMMQSGKYENKDDIIDLFRRWGRSYPEVGYGVGFMEWLLARDPKPYNSFGNGAAMRISPVGYYSRNIEMVKRVSNLVTGVSHNHPEGLKGALVVASIIFYLTIGKSKDYVKRFAEKYYNLDFSYDELVKSYDFDETSQNTVPQAIFCFLISESFEDAIRTAISIGGDSDTLTCITGGMAEAYYKHIPTKFIRGLNKCIPLEGEKCNPSLILNNYLQDKSITREKLSEVDNKTYILKRIIKNKSHKEIELIYSSSKDILINYLYERIKELGAEINDLVELRALKGKSFSEINTKLKELECKNSLREDFYLYKNKSEYLEDNNEEIRGKLV